MLRVELKLDEIDSLCFHRPFIQCRYKISQDGEDVKLSILPYMGHIDVVLYQEATVTSFCNIPSIQGDSALLVQIQKIFESISLMCPSMHTFLTPVFQLHIHHFAFS